MPLKLKTDMKAFQKKVTLLAKEIAKKEHKKIQGEAKRRSTLPTASTAVSVNFTKSIPYGIAALRNGQKKKKGSG